MVLYYYHDKALQVEPVEEVHHKVHNKMDLPPVVVHETVLFFKKIEKLVHEFNSLSKYLLKIKTKKRKLTSIRSMR